MMLCEPMPHQKLLPCLGIIAGSGDLPREIVKTCQDQGRSFYIVAYEGHTDPKTYVDLPHFKAQLGRVGDVIEHLKKMNVTELVLAGRFRRPSWFELKPDAVAAKWLTQSVKYIFGDDSLLQVILKNLEHEGFKICSAEDIVGAKILAPLGVLGTHQPHEQDLRDIDHGVKVAKILGRCDIGQSVVIQDGIVLGVEAIEGTDALIKRCQDLKREGAGGVLVKVVKPQQDIRVDRPTVGLITLEGIHSTGLRGLAIEANGVIVHQLSDMIDFANRHHIFLIGIASQ